MCKAILKESVMERSDAFKVQIDETTGLISYDNDISNKKMIRMPYCMKLLLQELQSIGIGTRLITENEIYQKPIFTYLQNVMKDETEEKSIDYYDDVELVEDLDE